MGQYVNLFVYSTHLDWILLQAIELLLVKPWTWLWSTLDPRSFLVFGSSLSNITIIIFKADNNKIKTAT